jgi:hypothetical protein
VVGFVAFVGSVALVVVAAIAQDSTGLPLVLLLVVGSAVWAAWDSSQIRLRDYKSGFSNEPVGIALGILLIWIVAFPVYLSKRYRISQGTLPRRQWAPPPEGMRVGFAHAETSTSELERLAELRGRGVLTEEEFSAAKGRVLTAPEARSS